MFVLDKSLKDPLNHSFGSLTKCAQHIDTPIVEGEASSVCQTTAMMHAESDDSDDGEMLFPKEIMQELYQHWRTTLQSLTADPSPG